MSTLPGVPSNPSSRRVHDRVIEWGAVVRRTKRDEVTVRLPDGTDVVIVKPGVHKGNSPDVLTSIYRACGGTPEKFWTDTPPPRPTPTPSEEATVPDQPPPLDTDKATAAFAAITNAALAPGPFQVEGWEPIVLWDGANDRAVRIENTGRFLRIEQGSIDRGIGSEADRFISATGTPVLVPHDQVIDLVKAILASSDPEVLFPWVDPCEEIDPHFLWGRTLEGQTHEIEYVAQVSGTRFEWSSSGHDAGRPKPVPVTDSGLVRVYKPGRSLDG